MNKNTNETAFLLEGILEGIRRIKGENIKLIDLNTIKHTECGYFVICHGNSTTQVNAIAHSVEETVEETTGIKVWHRDGYRNAIWILLDYGDVMVHIFQERSRQFYNLEGLWSDAKITQVEN